MGPTVCAGRLGSCPQIAWVRHPGQGRSGSPLNLGGRLHPVHRPARNVTGPFAASRRATAPPSSGDLRLCPGEPLPGGAWISSHSARGHRRSEEFVMIGTVPVLGGEHGMSRSTSSRASTRRSAVSSPGREWFDLLDAPSKEWIRSAPVQSPAALRAARRLHRSAGRGYRCGPLTCGWPCSCSSPCSRRPLPSNSPDWPDPILPGRPPPRSHARRPGEPQSRSSRDVPVGPVDESNVPRHASPRLHSMPRARCGRARQPGIVSGAGRAPCTPATAPPKPQVRPQGGRRPVAAAARSWPGSRRSRSLLASWCSAMQEMPGLRHSAVSHDRCWFRGRAVRQ